MIFRIFQVIEVSYKNMKTIFKKNENKCIKFFFFAWKDILKKMIDVVQKYIRHQDGSDINVSSYTSDIIGSK